MKIIPPTYDRDTPPGEKRLFEIFEKTLDRVYNINVFDTNLNNICFKRWRLLQYFIEAFPYYTKTKQSNF